MFGVCHISERQFSYFHQICHHKHNVIKNCNVKEKNEKLVQVKRKIQRKLLN